MWNRNMTNCEICILIVLDIELLLGVAVVLGIVTAIDQSEKDVVGLLHLEKLVCAICLIGIFVGVVQEGLFAIC